MRNFLLGFGLSISTLLANAQLPVYDTVNTAPQHTQMVFYKLADGTKTESSNTDWHLALSVRPTPFPNNPIAGVTARINEQLGVTVKLAAGNNASTYSSLDTANLANWPLLHDSPTNLDRGALNSTANPGNAFDFGWGKYNQSTYNVIGDSVFVFQLPGGIKKKLIIDGLMRDTAYDIRYSNLDNSNPQTLHIAKSNYAGKQLVYINLLDNTVKDKEPLSAGWDLLFTKYTDKDVLGQPWYAVTGVLQNIGVTIAEVAQRDVDNRDTAGLTFSADMNTIGWNWKQHTGGGIYAVEDSLAYFIKAKDGEYYHLVFTYFGGSANGKMAFTKSGLNTTLAIGDVENGIAVSVFPNPANGVVNILQGSPAATVRLADLNGRTITETKVTDKLAQLNTAGLLPGVYILAVSSNQGIATRRIVVSH